MKKLLFFLILIAVCTTCTHYQPQIVSSELIAVNTTEKSANNEISQWILPYKTALNTVMGVKIGQAQITLDRGLPECLLGNFITEVMGGYAKKQSKNYDFIITNIGGLREALPQGEITVGSIYNVFPFDNELVMLTLSGKKVEQLCQEIALQGGQITSGIEMYIDTISHEGKFIHINNLPLDTNRNYQVLTTDYLSFGNDKLYALADYSAIYSLKKPLREAIIEYVKKENKKGKKITAKLKNKGYL
ncbi:MAG: 5'-nucleotidase C-terminal domain-containing protein [Prevotellaceae bacterium]|nr:5'-nucleotidase C-terminal domain-containing protein [Prevotellaceae bacterium]